MSNIPEIYERARKIGFVGVVDTAKLIRRRLKDEFPSVKFRVKTSRYAVGGSVYVSWTDGPSQREVSDAVKPYQGTVFDAMIDMASPVTAYLTPDGVASVAEVRGTVASKWDIESYRSFKPSPDAVRVNFGADVVLCSRSETR